MFNPFSPAPGGILPEPDTADTKRALKTNTAQRPISVRSPSTVHRRTVEPAIAGMGA